MAWTQSDLDKIKAAIASGARTVSFATHSVTYHSLEEMMQIKEQIEKEIASTSSTVVKMAARHQLADFSDG